jgi:hypothetical protein
MAEPTIEVLLDVMHDQLALLRDKAIAINLVSADLLRRGYYVYRQEMPDELYHLQCVELDLRRGQAGLGLLELQKESGRVVPRQNLAGFDLIADRDIDRCH